MNTLIRYVFGERVFGKFLLKYGVFTDDDNLLILQETENTVSEAALNLVAKVETFLILQRVPDR